MGYDAGKKVKGRKRFLTVDTLGLVLRVLVTSASVGERNGGKQVLNKVKQMGASVARLHTVWVDGGNDCDPFMQWVMNFCRWTRASSAATLHSARGLSCCPSAGSWSELSVGLFGVVV